VPVPARHVAVAAIEFRARNIACGSTRGGMRGKEEVCSLAPNPRREREAGRGKRREKRKGKRKGRGRGASPGKEGTAWA